MLLKIIDAVARIPYYNPEFHQSNSRDYEKKTAQANEGYGW